MRFQSIQKALVVGMVVLFAQTTCWAGNAELMLRKTSTQKGPMIRLGDIADISASNPQTMHNLSTTPLLPVPAPGTTKFLHRSQLKELLRSRGIDLRQLKIWGAEVVQIGEGLPAEKKPAPQRLTKIQQKPMAKVEQPVVPTYQAIVLLRKLSKGDLIRESDVELKVQENRPSSSALTHIEEVIGMEARHNLSEGKLLLKNQIRKPLQVKRGETVTVFARTGGVTVKTYAVARQDGAQGDLVQVETLDKEDRYAAYVSGLRELEVFASGKNARELASLPGNKRQTY